MRKLFISFALVAGVIFILTQIQDFGSIVDTVKRSDLRFLFLAVVVQGIWLLNVAALYRAIYRVLGIEESLIQMMVTAAAANFVNVVTPTAGVGGMAIFISEARRKDYSSGRTTVASAMFVLFDYIGFLMVLALGLTVLFRRDKLQVTELAASGVLLMIALTLASLLYLGMYSEQKLGRFLAWGGTIVNKVAHPLQRDKTRDYLSIERAYTFARDISEGMRELRGKPKELVVPLLLALNSKVLLIIVLFLIFMAFGVPPSLGTLIAGFSIAFLFMIVSPSPSGVGFVEGALTLTLASFYIPLSDAAVIAIAYRGITFWLPLLFGMVAIRSLDKLKTETQTSTRT
ncbi:YbhN family protein [Chloroflexota bacterium]